MLSLHNFLFFIHVYLLEEEKMAQKSTNLNYDACFGLRDVVIILEQVLLWCPKKITRIDPLWASLACMSRTPSKGKRIENHYARVRLRPRLRSLHGMRASSFDYTHDDATLCTWCEEMFSYSVDTFPVSHLARLSLACFRFFPYRVLPTTENVPQQASQQYVLSRRTKFPERKIFWHRERVG